MSLGSLLEGVMGREELNSCTSLLDLTLKNISLMLLCSLAMKKNLKAQKEKVKSSLKLIEVQKCCTL